MSTIKNNINTYADLTAYNADLNKDYPNISYIKGTDEVKWYKYDPEHIVAVYNVTSTDTATTLLYSNSGITYQIIDGVQQSSVQTTYTFDTLGEHTVKYKLTGTNIGNYAFQNCRGLRSVTIPDSVTSIYNSAFNSCNGLRSVTIGTGITNIYNMVFSYDRALINMTILAQTPPTLGVSVFANNADANITFYVPVESVETYKAASGWSTYASKIQAIPTT